MGKDRQVGLCGTRGGHRILGFEVIGKWSGFINLVFDKVGIRKKCICWGMIYTTQAVTHSVTFAFLLLSFDWETECIFFDWPNILQCIVFPAGSTSGNVVPMTSDDKICDPHDYDEVPMDDNRASMLPLPPLRSVSGGKSRSPLPPVPTLPKIHSMEIPSDGMYSTVRPIG